MEQFLTPNLLDLVLGKIQVIMKMGQKSKKKGKRKKNLMMKKQIQLLKDKRKKMKKENLILKN